LATGLSFSFAVVGVSLAAFGFSIGIDPTTMRFVVAALMLAAGLILLVPRLQTGLVTAAGPVMRGGQSLADRIQPAGLSGQFLLGAALGAIWSPCSGPTLGAAATLPASWPPSVSAPRRRSSRLPTARVRP
jgi:cytochrome c biogenesis protein CcdA